MVRSQGAQRLHLGLLSCLDLESHNSSKPEGPLEGFHVLNLGVSHSYLEFVWNIHLSRESTNSLHCILKGSCNPRSHTLWSSPHSSLSSWGNGGAQGVSWRRWDADVDSRMLVSASLRWRPPSTPAFQNLSGVIWRPGAGMWEGEGWASLAFSSSSAGVSDKGEVQGLVSLFLLHWAYMTNK